jgi:inosine-uridine nucleoside N-ribohydrolase
MTNDTPRGRGDDPAMTLRHLALPAAAVLVALAACGPAAPSVLPPAPSTAAAASATLRTSITPRASVAPPSAEDPVPVIFDTDLAADDVFALLAVLRDPAVDLRAVTIAATGEVHCVPGLRTARRILAAFGRAEVPVACGRETPGPNGRWFPPEWRAGADAFYGVELPPVDDETARGETAPELLVRVVAESPEPLTLLTVGPFSNVADAARLDPAFASRLAGIHAMAGTIDAPGNVEYGETSAADGVEWNVGADPDALAEVLALDVPITLVGLDATNDVPVPPDIVEQLAADHAAAGADIAYEMYARTPFLADGTSSYWDPLAALTLTDPSIAGWEDLAVTMEPTGPAAGRLARDPAGRPIRAAMSADRDAFMARFLAALRAGGPRADPFALEGSLEVRWDGNVCQVAGEPPASAGLVKVTLVNTSEQEVGLALGGATPPKTWGDILAFMGTADLSDPNFVLPDWVVPVPLELRATPGELSTAAVQLPAGEVGVLCGAGTFPDLTFHDGGTFIVGG